MRDLRLHSRSSFRLALLAALFFTASFVPLRLVAQEATPASTATPAAQSAPATEAKSAAQSDEAQKNVFRLEGPLVKWTAKTLNKSPEFAANLFDYINFGIVVLLIGVPLVKILPKVLRGRGEKVRVDIESARKATEEANARLSAIEAKLAGLDGEIDKIRVQVETESRQDEERIKASLGEESARIIAAAEQEIASSAQQARRSLRNFAADLAIDQATAQLKLTPENDRALIAEFLADATLTGTSAQGGQK